MYMLAWTLSYCASTITTLFSKHINLNVQEIVLSLPLFILLFLGISKKKISYILFICLQSQHFHYAKRVENQQKIPLGDQCMGHPNKHVKSDIFACKFNQAAVFYSLVLLRNFLIGPSCFFSLDPFLTSRVWERLDTGYKPFRVKLHEMKQWDYTDRVQAQQNHLCNKPLLPSFFFFLLISLSILNFSVKVKSLLLLVNGWPSCDIIWQSNTDLKCSRSGHSSP